MTPSDKIRAAIAHVRELSNVATPGPWLHTDEYADQPKHFVIQANKPFYCVVAECLIDDDSGAGDNEQRDADFIAHARTALPRHADALEVAVRAIQEQSHAPKCNLNTPYPFGDTARSAWDAKGCDCWKQDALAAIAAKLEGKP